MRSTAPLTYAWAVGRRQRHDEGILSPNQVVAFNVAKARLLRGWTQEQAADVLAPYLGSRLSTASFSAIERSVDSDRVREFTADEILAFARGFELPIGWFFTPPSRMQIVGIRTPDTTDAGLDPQVMLDAVLGTPETLADWERILLTWPAGSGHRVRFYDEGTIEHLGRTVPDVHDRPAEWRNRVLLRQVFGDVDEFRRVLDRLVELLGKLDEGERADTTRNAPARKPSRSKSTKAKPKRSRR
jgi:hypothetical protein